ncbi:MAG: chromosomal replication initiator protein DnaA [Candidatus Andersenbacteria bacterium]
MKTDQLWKAALGQLELRVSQGNFLTWFRNTKIKERKKQTVVIETDNPFAYEWLSKKYRPIILEVLQKIDTSVTGIEFSVPSQAHGKRTARKNLRVIAQKQRVTQPPVASAPQAVSIHTSIPRASFASHQSPIPFNPKNTFENFVVGPSNEVAHAACRAVVDNPGESYNPLFVYGGVGLGKTHLLQAVGNALLSKNPNFRILYVASEKFMTEFVEALRHKKMHEFKKTYRDIDMFIIDDVQFVAGKDKIQEELFHTFNTLHSQNKQVILSSDRPPGAISALQERLSSRLGAGMVVDIKKPDYETRLAILEEKLSRRGASIDSEALSFLAKNIQSNVRELEGALNRVIGHSEVHNEKITIDFVKRVLHDLLEQSQKKTINTREIIEAVSSYYNLPQEEICGQRRNKEIVRPRQIAMYLLRKESSMSFPSIGEFFGGRDHTTAMHACEKIEKLLEHDEELSQEISFLKERLYA